MFRNQYDNDITTWSPQGRLHQVEYAMEAVKQGSATVGAKNKTHAVLVALKRSPQTDLSAHQSKTFKLDSHVGMTIAGLNSDARLLASFMRTECMNHRYVYTDALPVARLVLHVADKSQRCTQVASKRPFGVGLLIAGYDQQGPSLYQTCPSGQYYNYRAMAIGARSQSAKTYLEKHFTAFEDCSVEDLVVHCLKALKSTCSDGIELNQSNTSVAIVGKGTDFVSYDDDAVAKWIDLLHRSDTDGGAPAAEGGAAAPMEE
jgi:20S proteasome subunit alpha 6